MFLGTPVNVGLILIETPAPPSRPPPVLVRRRPDGCQTVDSERVCSPYCAATGFHNATNCCLAVVAEEEAVCAAL